jgi:site-specific recombinase XerD
VYRIARADKEAKLLYHQSEYAEACTGSCLANHDNDTRVIQNHLGHANIKDTVIYAELPPWPV